MFKVKHKFGAQKCEADSIKFPSKLERSVYKTLKQLQQDGKIRAFLRQIPFDIPGGKHIVDFMVFTSDEVIFIEAKGKDLPEGKRKRAAVMEIYGFPIGVVTDAIQVYSMINHPSFVHVPAFSGGPDLK